MRLVALVCVPFALAIFTATRLLPREPASWALPPLDEVAPGPVPGARANEDFWSARPFSTGIKDPRRRPALVVGWRRQLKAKWLGRDPRVFVAAFPQGRLDDEKIQHVIERRMKEIVACYQGRVAAWERPWFHFDIDEEGRVGVVSRESGNIEAPFVERCIRDEIARWKFPPPRRSRVWTYYPFGV